jgi:hypothetical protein
MSDTFTMTTEHLTLLRAMYVEWEDAETGAPCIDPKRPYGNSDVGYDVARLLRWELFKDQHGEMHMSEEQADRAERLHKETQLALQLFLLHAKFEPDTFVKGQEWNLRSWRRSE